MAENSAIEWCDHTWSLGRHARSEVREMKERQILFSGPMVRAILSGAKSQTRRVLRDGTWWTKEHGVIRMAPAGLACTGFAHVPCPYGAPGDRLWVREAFHGYHWDKLRAVYRADGERQRVRTQIETYEVGRWTPSIHMPRWASRITLEITGVRVERLQDISDGDAIAEGITYSEALQGWHTEEGRHLHCAAPIESYASLWESISAGSWDANPFVWVVAFKRA